MHQGVATEWSSRAVVLTGYKDFQRLFYQLWFQAKGRKKTQMFGCIERQKLLGQDDLQRLMREKKSVTKIDGLNYLKAVAETFEFDVALQSLFR